MPAPSRSAPAPLRSLSPVIFRRLHAVGADWIYHSPELYLLELQPRDSNRETSRPYSVARGAADTLKA